MNRRDDITQERVVELYREYQNITVVADELSCSWSTVKKKIERCRRTDSKKSPREKEILITAERKN